MSQQKNRKTEQIIPGERVGRFHFAPTTKRQFRLVAVLFSGARETIATGPTIGDLWRQPWLVRPELESEVVGIRVEERIESRGQPHWSPLWTEAATPSRDDKSR